MNPIQCFMIAPTNRVLRGLRRFAFSSDGSHSTCPGGQGYHDAQNPFPDGTCRTNAHGCWVFDDEAETPAHEDSRWPQKCSNCDYVFKETDCWQLWHEVVYARTDTGEPMTIRNAPPGAMWDADWYPWKGPDGKSLVLKVPGGDWAIDAPSSSGTPWVRTGVPPKITARPSIDIPGRYHGFLTDGQLHAV